jgi:hypothetical protein
MNPAPSTKPCLAALLAGSLLLGACQSTGSNKAIETDPIDVKEAGEPVFYVRSTYQGPYMLDSADLRTLDTTNAKGKRRWRIHQFCLDHSPSGPLCDTLLDLNYDGHLDHVLGGYGSSGTGIKYFWEVHLWDTASKRYHPDTLLNLLPNPTFFPKDSVITSFYLGYGAGGGRKFEWRNARWQVTLSFSAVNNEEKDTWWQLKNPLSGTTDSIHLPYSGVPPRSIIDYRTE